MQVIQLCIEEPYQTRKARFYGSRVAVAKYLYKYIREMFAVGLLPEGMDAVTFEASEEYDRFLLSLFDKHNQLYAVPLNEEEDIWLKWKLVDVIT